MSRIFQAMCKVHLPECVYRIKGGSAMRRLRILFGICCFLLGGFLLLSVFGEILRLKTAEETDMVHSFYGVGRDELDVLFLGSSHLYYGVQPNELWKEYGITSYVLGSPDQTTASSYYLLKEAFKYQSPKVVALESYYLGYDKPYYSEERAHQAFDGMRLGGTKLEMISELFSGKGPVKQLTFCLPFVMYHDRWSELEDYDFNSASYLKGARIDYTVRANTDPKKKFKKKDIPELNREYLEKIIALCEENGAEFTMFAVPYGVKGSVKKYRSRQGVNVFLEEFLAGRGMPFLFYQRDYPELIDFATDFRDKVHLNTAGAKKLSHHLGGWLKEQYGLEDHRGEERFASWEEDLARYEAAIAAAEEAASGA